MAVAALLDLGADREVLMNALNSLNLDGYKVEITEVKKNGIKACDFNVILDHPNHDHDMNYLHGKTACSLHHAHEHEHEHGRCLSDILKIIDSADISENAKELAVKIFRIIAEAEAKVHQKSIDTVHFHEVGAVDSIVDIVAFAVCFDNLGFDEVYIPFLCEGFGTIRCQHGILPIPVPATTEIVLANGLKLRSINVEGELVTPTGAGIASAVITGNVLPREYCIKAVGIGAGKRKYRCPGVLRVMEIDYPSTTDYVIKIESNVDDCSGEILGALIDDLMEMGVRDAFFTPVFMKKNRPAYMLTVICDECHISNVEELIFTETTTIGVRKEIVERTILERKIVSVKTDYGVVKVKVCTAPDGLHYYPEFDSVKAIAHYQNVPYVKVYDAAVKVARKTVVLN